MIELEARDVAPYCAHGQDPQGMVEYLNRIMRNKQLMSASKVLEADAKTFPMVHLSVRIEEIVKSMVGAIMLSDHETKELVTKAFDAAIARLDLTKEVEKAIEHEIEWSTKRAITNALNGIFYDGDVKAALKKRIVKALSEEDEE